MASEWSKRTFRRILRLFVSGSTPMARLLRDTAKQHWKLLLLYLGFVLLLGLSEACLFATIYRTISLLFTPGDSPLAGPLGLTRGQAFPLLLALISILQVIASISRAMASIFSGRFAASCQAMVLPEIHRYLLGLSYSCVSGFKIGELSHQATIAPLTINTEIDERIRILTEASLACAYLLILIFISPWLLLMACFLGFGIVLSQSWLRPRIRHAAMSVEQQRHKVSAAITADLQVLRLIHSNACQDDSNKRFSQEVAGLEARLKRLSCLRSLVEPTAELLPVLAAVLLGVLSWRLTNGQNALLIPSLATFVLALQRLNVRMAKLALSFNALTENQSRVEILNQLLTPTGKTFRRRGGAPFPGLQREISFQNVSFRYPNRQRDTLASISFTIPCHGMVALVGASGAGKSTIVDLLVGLLEPSAGAILVDGKDLSELDLDHWQRSLGVVSQDVLMVHDTIAVNLAFGTQGPLSLETIRKAAMAANADGFISQLPEGYNTVIGEHGHRLSGGQRQRLSLARAMLRNPDLLILDEATSALDSHSEAQVHAALESFGRGRTVLSIAHRLSSIRHADTIIVIDAGRIVERGSHDELIRASGPYASLWTRQIQGKLAI
jgi:ATP-binding cassette subfamily B protein/subfamily B ATP-binding cassette protein MsbA